jgi:hypothetical protein
MRGFLIWCGDGGYAVCEVGVKLDLVDTCANIPVFAVANWVVELGMKG